MSIDGTTIHAGLGINPNSKRYTLGKLSEALKAKLRFKHSELVGIIIDKISLVSNVRLLQIHESLCEIFGCSEAIPFARKTVIFVGDLFQLPPVRTPNIFLAYNSVFRGIFHLWNWQRS